MTVVLLDLHLGDGSDVAENVERLRARGAGVLIVTSDHRPAVVGRALDAGALGLVLKEDPEDVTYVNFLPTWWDTFELFLWGLIDHVPHGPVAYCRLAIQ